MEAAVIRDVAIAPTKIQRTQGELTMIRADHISLSSGQSFRDVEILESQDYDTYGIPKISGEMTFAFMADGNVIVLNQWNLRVVTFTKKEFKSDKYTKFDRLVLEKDIIYQHGRIVDKEFWTDLNIKNLIGPELRQFVWTAQNGLMMSHDANICALILKDTRTGNTDKIVPRTAVHMPMEVRTNTYVKTIETADA